MKKPITMGTVIKTVLLVVSLIACIWATWAVPAFHRLPTWVETFYYAMGIWTGWAVCNIVLTRRHIGELRERTNSLSQFNDRLSALDQQSMEIQRILQGSR